MPNSITEHQPAAPTGQAESKVQQQPARLDSFVAKMFFALFDDPRAAQAVAQRLRDAGAAEHDVEVFAGSDGAVLLQPHDEPTGLLDRIVQMTHELSDYKTFIEECAVAVGGGKALLLARFDEEASRIGLEAEVRQAGGTPLAYTDSWTLIKYS